MVLHCTQNVGFLKVYVNVWIEVPSRLLVGPISCARCHWNYIPS